MKNYLAILLLATLLLLPAYVHSQSYLGSTLWSGMNDVKIQGNFAYCAFFNGLMILDVSDSDTPTFVSQYYIGGDWHEYGRWEGQRLSISGNYVYFAADYKGLNIINVTDPANPTLASRYLTPTYASDVFVQDSLAYIVCIHSLLGEIYSSLQILNVVNPDSPISLGNLDLMSDARGIWVQGNYAYVADDLSGLQIIDISDPTNPIIAANYDGAGSYALDVTVRGNYAYIAWGYSGLVIVDITNPLNPIFVGSWVDQINVSWIDGVTVDGDYAYLTSDGRFYIVDISDPSHPTSLSNLQGNWYFGLDISGNYAYISSLDTGLRIVNISDPQHPLSTGAFSNPGPVIDVAASGNYAYLASWESGLNVMDISDPLHPQLIGNWSYYDPYGGEWNAIENVCISGNYAYCFNGRRGFQILDISNPRNPVSLGSYGLLDIWDIAVIYPYAYLAAYVNGLYIMDVSDPAHPAPIGNYNTPDNAWGVAVQGDYAYVGDGLSLQIINISDPHNPTFVSSSHGECGKLTVSSNYAYLTDDTHFVIVDISDPANPIRIRTQQTGGIAIDIKVSGNYAYIAEARTSSHQARLDAFDISNPVSPILADSFYTPGDALGFSLLNNNVYLGDDFSFIILHSDLTAIENDERAPTLFSLSQNYPNPFNTQTVISYSLSKAADVTIVIFDLLGRKVETLIDGMEKAGNHEVTWDAVEFPSGVYFARLKSDESEKNIKIVLMK